MGFFGKKQEGVTPPARSVTVPGDEAWVLRAEGIIMRLVSLIFSVGSAYAIARVFAPTTDTDIMHTVIDWVIAGGFGVLGYFLSRNIAYRMMRKEQVWLYVPICFIVELVEIFCNYVIGVSDVAHASWLLQVPVGQRGFLSMIADIVLSIIPAVTLTLAVAEMDLEKRKNTPKTDQMLPATMGSSRPAYQANRGSQPASRPGTPPQGVPRPNMPPGAQRPGTSVNPPPGVRPQPQQPVGAMGAP